MQIGSDFLKRQQEIMQARGFYSGKIDGIWGPKSISAKQKWERSGKFNPGIPNNGFPLDDRSALPKGVRRLPDGMLTCAELEQQKNKQPQQPQQVQTPQQTKPEEPAASVEIPTKIEAAFPVPQNQQNNKQQHGNNKK